MITKEDIHVKQEPSELREGMSRLRVGLQITVCGMISHDGDSDMETDHAKQKIWSHLYGDLELDVVELRDGVMRCLAIGSGSQVLGQFEALLMKLRFHG